MIDRKNWDNIKWGESLEAIRQEFPGKKLKGIDINKNILDGARNYLDDIELEYGDVNKLDIPDKSYDVVFTSALLCMLTRKDAEYVLKEIIRIAKKHIVLVELDGKPKFEYIGLQGRLAGNYLETLKELGINIVKFKFVFLLLRIPSRYNLNTF